MQNDKRELDDDQEGGEAERREEENSDGGARGNVKPRGGANNAVGSALVESFHNPPPRNRVPHRLPRQ